MSEPVENDVLRRYLQPKEILVLEDDGNMCELLRGWSRRMNCTLSFAPDGETGLRMSLERDWYFVLVDLGLPRLSGLDVIRQLKAKKPGLLRLAAISGGWNEEWFERLKQLGCFIFITKPSDFTQEFFENLLLAFGVNYKESPAAPPATTVRPIPHPPRPLQKEPMANSQ